jgi:putative transposase
MEVDEEAVVELVKRERQAQPKLGVRKLNVLLEAELSEAGISMGRDRMFDVLRERDMLVVHKRQFVKTTDSRHGFRTRPNLIRNIIPSMPHQVWVSDLTYIRTDDGFMYLSLVTDAFSRKIVGFDISDTLEATGCIRALKMALRQLPEGARPIHHSDRGTQYCCGEYTKLLRKRGCPISMTELNHCYENALAERVNGILKGEYALGEGFRNKHQAIHAVGQAVMLYNERRPHTSLNYRFPAEVHAMAHAA